jgi:hypothetical protein
LNTSPEFNQGDPYAVNVFVERGIWAGELLGHIATIRTFPVDNLNWGHAFSAIMNNDITRLPLYFRNFENLSSLVEFTCSCSQETTHRPSGSSIQIIVSIHDSLGTENNIFIDELFNFFCSFSLPVVEKIV